MKVGDLIRIWPIPRSQGQTMSEENVKIALVYHREEGRKAKVPTWFETALIIPTTLKILIGSRKARIWQSWNSRKTTWTLQDPDSSSRVKLVEVENLGSSKPEDDSIPPLEK